jgi:hypothetical protein
MLRRWVWVLILLALCPSAARAQGRIEQIRQDANQPDSSSAGDNSHNNHSGGGNSKGGSSWHDDDCDDSMGLLVLYGITLPFWLPHKLMDDDLRNFGYFPACPYPDDYPAYLWQGRRPNSWSEGVTEEKPPETRWWSVRLAVEDGNDFNGINRLGVRATVDTASRFGLQSNWNYLYENLGGGRHDDTVIGDTSLTYRFAQHEQIQMFAGVGFRVLTDPCVTNWGVNFLYGFDYFPAKPLVCSGQIDGGSLGSAGVFHARATLGVVKEHFELFGGYDFMRVGSVNIQGPMLGLRFWF